eukprot:Awhi_evm1s6260
MREIIGEKHCPRAGPFGLPINYYYDELALSDTNHFVNDEIGQREDTLIETQIYHHLQQEAEDNFTENENNSTELNDPNQARFGSIVSSGSTIHRGRCSFKKEKEEPFLQLHNVTVSYLSQQPEYDMEHNSQEDNNKDDNNNNNNNSKKQHEIKLITKNNVILKDFNFSVKKGEHLAIVGETGMGKSSILKLLSGLLNPMEGHMTLYHSKSRKNIIVDQVYLSQYRRKIAMVSQESPLFSRTIRDNITYGLDLERLSPEIVDQAIERAMELGCLKNWICSLPDQLDTLLTNGDIQRSGGQKQRVQLTRLFLSGILGRRTYKNQSEPSSSSTDQSSSAVPSSSLPINMTDDDEENILIGPEIVLLDEPTSALDVNTQEIIVENLRGFLKDRTLILVTHRLELLDLCTNVYTLAYCTNNPLLEKQVVAKLNSASINTGRPSMNASVGFSGLTTTEQTDGGGAVDSPKETAIDIHD